MTISSMPIEEKTLFTLHSTVDKEQKKTKDSKFTANYYTQSL